MRHPVYGSNALTSPVWSLSLVYMFVTGLRAFSEYGLNVETEDFSTEFSLPTGREGSCQEMVRHILRGRLTLTRLMAERPKLKAQR